MTVTPAPTMRPDGARNGGSPFWRHAFRALFASSPAALPRTIRRVPPFGIVEELLVKGRRTGRERSVFVAVFDIDGTRYVGHPNGGCDWTRNLEAAGRGVIVRQDGSREPVRAVRLADGPERDIAIATTGRAQPLPFRAIYRRGGRHIRDVGWYFRLEPTSAAVTSE